MLGAGGKGMGWCACWLAGWLAYVSVSYTTEEKNRDGLQSPGASSLLA